MHTPKRATTDEQAELIRQNTLTILQAARLLGVGESGLRGALRRGEIELPVIEIGARRVIPTSAVRRLLGLEAVA